MLVYSFLVNFFTETKSYLRVREPTISLSLFFFWGGGSLSPYESATESCV